MKNHQPSIVNGFNSNMWASVQTQFLTSSAFYFAANFVHGNSFSIRSSSYIQYGSKFLSYFLHLRRAQPTLRWNMKLLRIMKLLQMTDRLDSICMRKGQPTTPVTSSPVVDNSIPRQRSFSQNQNSENKRKRRDRHDGKHPMYLF